MTALIQAWLALVAAALMWPVRRRLAGRRIRSRARALPPVSLVVAPATGAAPPPGVVPFSLAAAGSLRPIGPAARSSRPGRSIGRRRLRVRAGRVSLGVLVVAGVVLAGAAGGAVAGVVTGIYGALSARTVVRRHAERDRTARHTGLLDLVGSAAADLRAGLPAATALAGIPDDPADPLLARVRSAILLAERTGAPLADVLDRIEADTRNADRARLAATAQAAGSRATAWLLAALPAGGIALGYAIGADPLTVLLRTPIGAACAFGAVALQLAGLGWAGRLVRTGPVVAS